MPNKTPLLGIKFCVPKRYAGVLTPGTAERASFGNQNFTRETKLHWDHEGEP